MSSEHNEAKLKLALAGMLPNVIDYDAQFERFHWKGKGTVETVVWPEIRDTEWLHVCHLVERALTRNEHVEFSKQLSRLSGGDCSEECLSASWPLRAHALCIVKGVEV